MGIETVSRTQNGLLLDLKLELSPQISIGQKGVHSSNGHENWGIFGSIVSTILRHSRVSGDMLAIMCPTI